MTPIKRGQPIEGNVQETNGPDREEKNYPSSVEPRLELERLRLTQDFSANVGVKKVLITVPVRKPTRQEFIRVHPGEDWHIETAILELNEESETYLVERDLWPELGGEIKPVALFTTTNRQGVLTIWPARLPREDGRFDAWGRSALEAVELAKKRWIRVVANMSLGAYEPHAATANFPDPLWPDMEFPELLGIAFRDHFIDSMDHPVVQKLRGAI
jgi:hypothetical protein